MSTESTTSGGTSATLEAVRDSHTGDRHTGDSHTGYGALWRRVPRELGFLLLTLPLIVVALSVLSGVFFAGVGTVVVFVGLFLIVAALYVARGFGTLELVRLRWAGQPAILPPRWRSQGTHTGVLQVLFVPLANGHYWLYLLHGMVVNFIVGVVSWVVTIVWVSVGLGGVTFWFWARFLPIGDRNLWLHQVVADWLLPGNSLSIDPYLGESVFEFAIGVVFLLTLPLITRAFVLLHRLIASGMLGAWRSEALQREVADVNASRGAALAAEDQSLRRLERDIHDGPQQRLVRLQMDLASAERTLESDPDAARALLAAARGQARDTLDELRALSRGFAPPILQDRGLAAALESLAGRSTVPVTTRLTLDPAVRLAPELERSAYYLVAELLSNAAKHAAATAVGLWVGVRREPGQREATWLDVWVTDNGTGGARLEPGHGLQGLDERVRGLRGTLVIDSPPGGPTRIGAQIPITDTWGQPRA